MGLNNLNLEKRLHLEQTDELPWLWAISVPYFTVLKQLH